MTTTASQQRWVTTHSTLLPIYEHDRDEICAPPSRVVEVDVIADRVFLHVRDYAEDAKTTTLTTVVSEAVSAEALLLALIAQLGVEWVQALLRRVSDGER